MSFPTNSLQNSPRKAWCWANQGKMRAAKPCAQGINPSELEELHSCTSTGKSPGGFSLRRCLRASLEPLCAILTLLSTGVWRIPGILTRSSCKTAFKTKCSMEMELAVALCAFSEMSAALKEGTSELLSFGLLWCIFWGFSWWVFLRFNVH